MTNLSKLLEVINNDPNVKRMKSLEKYFDSNEDVINLIHRKQEISKQLVNSRVLHLKNNSASLKEEYDNINEQIKDYPFLDEYLDLLNYYHDEYLTIINYLEKTINNSIFKDSQF